MSGEKRIWKPRRERIFDFEVVAVICAAALWFGIGIGGILLLAGILD